MKRSSGPPIGRTARVGDKDCSGAIRRVTIWVRVWLWLWVVALVLPGCKAEPVRADLQAVDAESRIAGFVAASQSDDPEELDHLVDALEDDDPAVRLFAAEALRRRTGQNHGFHAYHPKPERDEAVTRWRAFIDGSLTAATTPTTDQPEESDTP